jgi:succinate dehydrogenase / fumarate reductase, cytochrome b subunit
MAVMAERPLSPHVTVYRWAYTMTLSILHRVTGLALFLALIGLIAWLLATAAGSGAYARAMTTLTSVPVKCLIAIALLALCYHFCNGLRHLAWDMGLGFERAQARRSALIVVVVALLAAAVCLYFLFGAGGTV